MTESFLLCVTAGFIAGIIGGRLSRARDNRMGNEKDVAEPKNIIAANVIATGEFLLTKDGKARARLGISHETGEPFLSLLDKQERARVGLTACSNGLSGVLLSDADGKSRVGMGVDSDNVARLLFLSADRTVRASLINEPEGLTYLKLNDKNEKSRIMLGVAPDGTPGILICDENGQSRLSTSFEANTSYLEVSDKTGKPLARISLADGEDASFSISNRDGEVIWRAP